MRIMLIALAALATTAIALPIAAHAEDSVVIRKDNGHHYGWRHRHHDKKVVVIKDRDRHRHHHYHSTTTGAGIGVGVHVGN